MNKPRAKPRYHRGSDPWGRGSYSIPRYAIVGSGDTGEWSDSPCPSRVWREELGRFRKDLLKETGIKSRMVRPTRSGNVFMIKRWVAVKAEDWERAADYALQWLELHKRDTRLIHDADIEDARKEVNHVE